MVNVTATPNIISDPGFLFVAPIGTALPTNTVVGSVFTDAWAAAWVNVGATDDGSTFQWQTTVEPVSVAELFDPIKQAVTGASGSMAFALADYTLKNLSRALNAGPGAVATVSGATTTLLSSLEPADPTAIVRQMIGWESLDATLRFVGRQVINASTIETSFKRAPDKSLIPVEFAFERPAAAKSWIFYSAGTARVGT
jgi:hypothetical protein